MNNIENKIFNFSVFNEYIKEDFIVDIALYICKKYNYDNEKIETYHNYFDKIEHCEVTEVIKNKNAAWDTVITAAKEKHDIYAIATILFYRTYHYRILENNKFFIDNKELLLEMTNILEEVKEKDGFIYFLLARAYYNNRVKCNDNKYINYFHNASKLGIEIAKVYESYINLDYNELFTTCSKLIEKYPTNHVIKCFLGLCYFVGLGVEVNNEKAVEQFKHTEEAITYSYTTTPIDIYYLQTRYYLGLCYFHGYGVKADLNRALNLFKHSSVDYLEEAIYAQAITYLLLEKENADSVHVYKLLVEASINGSLPAIRKTMLCIKNNYGVIYDEEAYKSYENAFNNKKINNNIYSELKEEADKCPLIRKDGTIIIDDIN